MPLKKAKLLFCFAFLKLFYQPDGGDGGAGGGAGGCGGVGGFECGGINGVGERPTTPEKREPPLIYIPPPPPYWVTIG